MQQENVEAAMDAAAEGGQEAISVLDLLMNGGFTMIPLFILLFGALYIFIERMLTLRKAQKISPQFMDNIRKMVGDGNVNEAQLLCAQTQSPIAKMIEKGISRIGSPLKNIRESIENVGAIELYRLEKNLNSLATISGAAPMIGFLGTVTGMIKAFIGIAQTEENVSAKVLSEGIYEAMITTATGLAVGIVAYLGYNYLVSQVQKVVHKMEMTSVEFIDLLQEPR
ncbi:MAG TPA: biopolymer transporter ExbB [Cytophagales bacterium]|nr:biopolymer transporter ExbB [Cytophagales bacterium]HAA24309.1 biopolymer transporter ExbB [Cytophagales bacterium]HAP59740.1 biopolymer transporter ExbB [Cytophagales bacterium]